MILRSFFIFCLIYFFGDDAFGMEPDPMPEYYARRLNQDVAPNVYSPNYLYYVKEAFPRQNDIPNPIGNPHSYRVNNVYFNGTPLTKGTDDDGKPLWRFTPYLEPNGQQMPIGYSIYSEDILWNFPRENFLTPRRESLSRVQYSLFQNNPHVYTEKEGDNFFLHHPFRFDAYSHGETTTIFAQQTHCFLTSPASSLVDYISTMHQAQREVPFRVQLKSNTYGSITLDMEAVYQEEISRCPYTPIYALNNKTKRIDVFVLTHFPAPFKAQLVMLDPTSQRRISLPHPTPKTSVHPPEDPESSPEEDSSDDDDWTLVDQQSAASASAAAEPEEPRGEIHPAPTEVPAPQIVPAPVTLDTFRTETQPPRIPNLFHFSESLVWPKDAQRDDEAYYTTLDQLGFALSSTRDAGKKARLLQKIKEATSQRTGLEAKRFDCFSTPTKDTLRLVGGKRSIILTKGSITALNYLLYLSDDTWTEKWRPTEGDPARFNQFLESCCRFLSGLRSISTTTAIEHVEFDSDFPSTGYYVENQESDRTVWQSYTLALLPADSAPPEQKSYKIKNLGHRLFFDEKNAATIESGDFSAIQNIESLIVHYVEMTPEREGALLKILEHTPFLSQVKINGCTFRVGMLKALCDALQSKKNLAKIDLSQNHFPEVHDPSQRLKDLMGMFTYGFDSLKHLIFPTKYGISVHYDGHSVKAPFTRYLNITHENIGALQDMAEEGIHVGINTLMIAEPQMMLGGNTPRYNHALQDTDLETLVTNLPHWRHIKYLSLIKGFEHLTLSHDFFAVRLKGFSQLHTLDLSYTQVTPHERNFAHLNTLSSSLRRLILIGCFNPEKSNRLDPKTLFPALKPLKLEFLDLSSNPISFRGDIEGDINKTISELPATLTTLRMSGCFQDAESFPLIAYENLLRHLQNLKNLDITESPFPTLTTPAELQVYKDFINLLGSFKRHSVALHVGYENSPQSKQLPRQSIFLYLEDDDLGEDRLVVTPFNIILFKKLLAKGGKIPFRNKAIEFQHLVFNEELSDHIGALLRNKFPHLEHLRMVDCFKKQSEFLRALKMCELLRNLQILDLSENPFHLFSDSYEQFKHHVSTLLKDAPILTTVIVTGQNGERIEWYNRVFYRRALERLIAEDPSLETPITSFTGKLQDTVRLGSSRIFHRTFIEKKEKSVAPIEVSQGGLAAATKQLSVDDGEAPKPIQSDLAATAEPLSAADVEKDPVIIEEVRGFFVNPALRNNIRFSEDIRFLGYTETLLFLHTVVIDNVELRRENLGSFQRADSPEASFFQKLEALPHLRALTLRNCFQDITTEQLVTSFQQLGRLHLRILNISGTVFSHKNFNEIVRMIKTERNLRDSLEELSLCIPNRENKVAKRTVIGTLATGAATVVGGVFVTVATGGFGTLPYIVGAGATAVAGLGSGASGRIANKFKKNKASRQCYDALIPFKDTNLLTINGYNVKRSPKGLAATKALLETATQGKIVFNLFGEI